MEMPMLLPPSMISGILPLSLEVVHAVREDVAALVVEARALGDSDLVSREPYERVRSRPDRLAEPGEPPAHPGIPASFQDVPQGCADARRNEAP
jgi:hypothetical protein